MLKRKFRGRSIGDEWDVSQDQLPSYLDYDATRLEDGSVLKIRPGLLPAMLNNVESRLYWKSNRPKDLLDCIVESQTILRAKEQEWFRCSGWMVLHPKVVAFIMRYSGVSELDIQENVLKGDTRIFSCGRMFGWHVYGYEQFPREEILLGLKDSEPYARITLDLSIRELQ